MSEPGRDEEIIDLTEVVEEGPGKPKTDTTEPEVIGPGKAGPVKEIFISGQEKEHIPGIGGKNADRSPAPPRHSEPLFPDPESEVRAFKETLTAKTQEWVASEGSRIMERVAREIFPRIAELVLRKEIEKLKAEVEEKE